MHLLFILVAAREPTITAEAPRPQSWSLGGGFGFAVYDSMPLGYGALGTPMPPPFRARVLAERRLTSGLWLMLQAQLSYTSAASTGLSYGSDASLASAQTTNKQEQYGGMIGLRCQFDLAGIVELSPYLLLGGAYSRQSSAFGAYAQQFEGGVARAQLGFTVERELVRGLALRFSTSVVEARYGRFTGVVTDATAELPTQSAMGGVAFVLEPTIDLRMRF